MKNAVVNKTAALVVPAIFVLLGARQPRPACAAAGTTSATFLKLGLGARPVAMGSAFVGLADDVNAVTWNPAGLVNVEKQEFSLMHLKHFQNMTYNSACYARPFGKMTAAFGFGYLYSDDIARTFIDEDSYGGYRRDGSYKLEDKTFFASAAAALAADKSLGVLLRWVSEKIEDHEAAAVSMDVGYLHLLTEDVSLGLSAQNIGGTMKFIAAEEGLPLTFRAGLGYARPGGKLKIAFDAVRPADYQVSFNLGAEYLVAEFLALRAGWRFKDMFFDDKLDDISGLSCGVGFAFYGYTLDYGFAPYGDLGYSHRISLGGKF